MRSATEIRFRLRQELTNLRRLILRPAVNFPLRGAAQGLLPPGPSVAARLAPTPYASEVVRIAGQTLEHKFPLFNTEIDTGPAIDWSRDYRNNLAAGLSYFRLIPYLDIQRAGDHKWVWELNRHQHLIVLAQAFLFTGDRSYVAEIEKEIKHWTAQNPFLRGINWTSALEVAFRAMSWGWVLHLVGSELAGDVVRTMEEGLYLHALYIENNLSVYFSPNTHLLGEAVALHALGKWFPHFPNAERIRSRGRQIVFEQMERQIHADGSQFEQSTYYHVYALDMFLFHAVLESVDEPYRAKLGRMAEFLHCLLLVDGRLPFLGDDDGGRWFYPYGDRACFGWATLAACNTSFGEQRWPCPDWAYWSQAYWWFPANAGLIADTTETRNAKSSVVFPDVGLVFLKSETAAAIFDAGPFAPRPAGHSHSDALSLIVSVEGTPWLIDPGTFTYVGSINERDEFRGSAAHNTIRIDTADQADPAGPFRWINLPQVQLLHWHTSAVEDVAEASCRYRGFEHRRYIHFLKGVAILIVDAIEGPSGDHLVEQFWHLESEDLAGRFQFAQPAELLSGWRSRCFGQREAAPVLRVARTAPLPIVLPAVILLEESATVGIAFADRVVNFHIQSPHGARVVTVDCAPRLR